MKLLYEFILVIFACNASNAMVELTESDFDEMIKGKSVFVKFYSPSCPHCIKLAPVWEKVAQIAPTYPQSFHVGMILNWFETYSLL